MQKQEYQPEKLRSLFHYVIKAAGSRPGFGATKLYKVAWFSDTKCFMLRGRSITGAKYIREKHGPTPQQAMPIRAALVADGCISQFKGPSEYEGWHFRSLRSPDLSVFDRHEIETINYWIKHIDEDHTADSISEESHDYGWEIAAMGEELPYYAFFAGRIREPSPEESARLSSRAKELGLI